MFRVERKGDSIVVTMYKEEAGIMSTALRVNASTSLNFAGIDPSTAVNMSRAFEMVHTGKREEVETPNDDREVSKKNLIHKYLDSECKVCPVNGCDLSKNEPMYASDPDFAGKMAMTEDAECPVCGGTWTNVYTMTDVRNAEEGDDSGE